MKPMTAAQQQRLVDAGLTADELREVIDVLQYAVVLAEAGEETKGIPLRRMDRAKMSALFGVIGEMKADEWDGEPDPWGDS